jgi:hypothetical protein
VGRHAARTSRSPFTLLYDLLQLINIQTEIVDRKDQVT